MLTVVRWQKVLFFSQAAFGPRYGLLGGIQVIALELAERFKKRGQQCARQIRDRSVPGGGFAAADAKPPCGEKSSA